MRFAALLAFCLFIAGPVAAQNAPGAMGGGFMERCAGNLPEQVPLNAHLIEGVMKSYDEVRGYAKAHKSELDALEEQDSCTMDLSQPPLAGTPLADGFVDIIKRYGFNDFKQWSNTAFSVMSAHRFADHPMPEGAMSAMADNPNIPPEMKARMAQSLALMAKMQPPPENVAAIAPYKDQLDALQQRIENDTP